MPVQDGSAQYLLYKGNTGAALNLELDYDGLISLHPGRLRNYLHLDAYLFADAGLLLDNRWTTATTKNLDLSTPLIMDAGPGFALTIKRWGMLDEPRPLTIRFDMPVFLSNAPFVDGDNLMFRWQIGINRAF